MARPPKSGLDWFQHETDANSDEKIEPLCLLYGNDGYAFYFIILERIYRTGNQELSIADDTSRKLLAARVRLKMPRFEKILATALERGLFDAEAYRERGVLTSDGIKRRAARFLERRTPKPGSNGGVNDDNNPTETQQKPSGNDALTPQESDDNSAETSRARAGATVQYTTVQQNTETQESETREADNVNSTHANLSPPALDIPAAWSANYADVYQAFRRWRDEPPDAAMFTTVQLLTLPRGHPSGAKIGDGKTYNGFTNADVVAGIEAMGMAKHYSPTSLVKHVAGLMKPKTKNDERKHTTSDERARARTDATIKRFSKLDRVYGRTAGGAPPQNPRDPDVDGRTPVEPHG